MVNVQKYQTVAIGDTVAECEKNYEKLLADNGIASGVGTESDISMTGTIEKMAQAVIEGNSHFYITLGGENAEVKGLEAGQTAQKFIFDIPVTEYPEIVGYDIGDTLTVHFIPEEPISTVTALGDKKPETQKFIFDIPVTEYPEIVGYDIGDTLTVHFIPEEPISTVTALGDKKPETGVDKKETTE